MRPLIAAGLTTLLLLSACQLPGVQTTGRKAGPAKAVASAKPTVKPSAALPTAVDGVLSGTLKMDASYVVAAGGGNVIAAGGGNVIAAGGGNVIAAGGGNVIAAGGGNVIAPGGGNYRTLSTALPAGTMLPASGMVVVALSVTTGKPLTEAVFTDAQGRYTLTLPKGLTENVNLVAAVPGTSETDPKLSDRRLQYSVLTKPSGARAIDEDTALATRYLRAVFNNKVQAFFQNMLKASDVALQPYPQGFRDMIAKAKAMKISEMPEPRQRVLYQRATRLLMAVIELDAAKAELSQDPALPTMVSILREIREAAGRKLAADPAHFAQASYIKEQPLWGCYYVIKKPSDINDFLVTKYLSIGDELNLNKTAPILADLGVPADRKNMIFNAALGLSGAMLASFERPEVVSQLSALLDEAATMPLNFDHTPCDEPETPAIPAP